MNPSNTDQILHSLSLRIAAAYHSIKVESVGEDPMLHDILDAFRSIRRGITRDENGKRWGASAAYKAMQGEI